MEQNIDIMYKKITEYESKLSDIEKRVVVMEQKLATTESHIHNELKEIKDSLKRLQNEYYDLSSKILDTVRNEIDKNLSKMDTYNSTHFERIDKELNDIRSESRKLMFLIVTTLTTVAFNLLLKLIDLPK